MYFVAAREYGTGRSSADCPDMTLMTGWLLPSGKAALAMSEVTAFVTDCDGKPVRLATPLGSLRVAGRVFWVLQEHGYEDVIYAIAEVTASSVESRLRVNGGGC